MDYANELNLMDGELKVKVVFSEEEEEEVTCATDYSELVSKGKIDVPAYCKAFIKECGNLEYSRGEFYDNEGVISEGKIAKMIADDVGDVIKDDPDRASEKILKYLKKVAWVESDYTPKKNHIPLADAELVVENKEFVLYEKKERSRYRLPCSLVADPPPTPYFDKWLNDLFYEDDIPVIQEMLGYCLIPTTEAQKCFILVGDGEQGKSILHSVLSGLLGNACISFHTKDLDNNRFSTANLIDKLVAFDDDLSESAFSSAEVFKKVVSASEKILVERKYKDSYEIYSYARLIACGNYMISSLYDTSGGFYRRLLPIITKPKDPNRVDIRDLGERIKAEANGILPWALVGLQRLMKNNFVFSETERTKRVIRELKQEANNVDDFIADDIEFSPDKNITMRDLIEAYGLWCKDNGTVRYADGKVREWIKNHRDELGLIASENLISKSNNRRGRGYKGMGLKINRSGTVTIK